MIDGKSSACACPIRQIFTIYVNYTCMYTRLVYIPHNIVVIILISLTPDFVSADPALLHQGHDKEAVGGDGPVSPDCLPSHLHHQDRGRLLLHLRLGVHAGCLTGKWISGCIRVYRVYICILSFQLVLYMINDFFKKIQYVVLKSHL